MKIKVTDETVEAVKTEQKARGMFLIEVQNHADGHFLVFDDKPQADTPPSLEERIKILETKTKWI